VLRLFGIPECRERGSKRERELNKEYAAKGINDYPEALQMSLDHHGNVFQYSPLRSTIQITEIQVNR